MKLSLKVKKVFTAFLLMLFILGFSSMIFTSFYSSTCIEPTNYCGIGTFGYDGSAFIEIFQSVKLLMKSSNGYYLSLFVIFLLLVFGIPKLTKLLKKYELRLLNQRN